MSDYYLLGAAFIKMLTIWWGFPIWVLVAIKADSYYA